MGRAHGRLFRTSFSNIADFGSVHPLDCFGHVGHDGSDPDFCLPDGMAHPPVLGSLDAVPGVQRCRAVFYRPIRALKQQLECDTFQGWAWDISATQHIAGSAGGRGEPTAFDGP